MSADISATERAALIALYNSTNGDAWTINSGWKTPPLHTDGFAMPGTENVWEGVATDAENWIVTRIDLNNRNLTGTIPSELGSLSNLELLWLNSNQLTGSIPTELGNLSDLIFLDLTRNQLSGSIPSELGNLSNLQSLYLYSNQLTGSIPSELGNLNNLWDLLLSSNQLTGSIPSELGNLSNLNNLDLNNNQLSGAIPTQLGSLSHLYHLYLHDNQLSGAIPTQLGNLSNLQELFFYSNQLTGSIPTELGSLSNLQSLYLSSNQLTGSIPSELGNLSNLQSLYLSSNQLTGSIPSELGSLSNLTGLVLYSNQLTGNIPTQLGNLSNLLYLQLNSNQLTGNIPTQLGSLSHLYSLYLHDNQLTGSIPTSLTSLTNLNSSYTDIGFNALYTSDAELITFLNSKDANWAATQTIAPTNVQAAPLSSATINLTWEAIPYNGDTGGYRIFIATISGGPYTFFQQTADKSATSLPVTGLNPGTPYYFVIQTRTDAHGGQQNIVDSENSSEATATTLTVPADAITLTLPNGDETWKVGSSHDITWTQTGLTGNVIIDLYKGGAFNSNIGNAPTSACTFSWMIPSGQAAGSDYKVRVFQGSVEDYSNASFSITSGTSNVTISGQAGIAGAVLSYDNGGPQTVTADGSGNYTITVPSGWSGTVTPTLAGYTFTPPSRSYSNVTSDQTAQNFTATSGGVGIPAIERAALIALFNSTNGDAWTSNSGWKTAPLHADGFALPGTENTWYGVTIAVGNTTVSQLVLNNNNLIGTISTQLGNLNNLMYLGLCQNQLTGTIPVELGNLSNLTYLELSQNQLTGTIPVELGNLSKLQRLYFYTNQLTGSIPISLGNLSNLEILELGGNHLTGSIPPELSNLSNLQYLCLYANQLTGNILPELGNLSNLQVLELYSNQLTGSIPAELGNLSNLECLDLEFNQLSGGIPTWLGSLIKMRYLWLASNQLTGSIPTELGNLSNLQNLFLHSNQLTGTIPASLGNLGNLKNLYLHSNQLTGSIPSELGSLSNLTHLDLNYNGLTGSIPSEIGSLSKLLVLQLNNNQLSGSIPTSLTNLSLITSLDIGYNCLQASDSTLRTWLDSHDADWEAHQDQCGSTASITVTAPNGGESWIATTSHNITWTTTGTISDVKIEYSINNGTDWSEVIASTPNDGNYEWTVPSTPSTQCLVRISDVAVPATIDSSDANFSIVVLSTYTISGTITVGGSPLTGVVMNGLPGNPATDSSGNYSALVNSGFSGTVTPTLSGYTFSPINRVYANVTSDQTAQNFTATSGGVGIPAIERAALIALYNSTNGDGWTNNSGWKTPPLHTDGFALPGTENTWFGVTTDAVNTTVLRIELKINNLIGTIPTQLGNLSNLQVLDLSSNWNLTGSIPPELGNLSNMTNLDLFSIKLTGSIPTELGNLSNLVYLNLSNNQLTGSIPTELGNLSNLRTLYLFFSQLTGNIPSSLGNLNNLIDLSLDFNQLSGSIPSSLGNLSNLTSLILRHNQLTGTIPTELGNLSNLQALYLYSNQLTGSIPTQLGSLSNLTTLYLNSNQLTGSIPTELGNLSNLNNLDLNNNQLTGTIPTALGNLSNLTTLNLNSNQLTGNIPPELGSLSNLYDLRLFFNQLTGTIPSELGNLSNLHHLYLFFNQLTGSIPPELGNLSNLYDLYLHDNQLTGSIPSELGNLSYLYDLQLNSNQLSGTIPTSLANLTFLDNSGTGTNIGYNALHTSDSTLITFLNSKDADWAATQTIAPTGVSATASSASSITVSWTPIPYTTDAGGYRVSVATNPGGPYTFFAQTTDKNVSSQLVSGLTPGSTYYFVVQTRTGVHANNQNIVDSENSSEATATTLTVPADAITLTLPNGGESWIAGSAHDITWTQTGLTGNGIIDLYKGGAFNSNIGNAPTSACTFSWKIPSGQAAGSDYTVRVYQGSVEDYSDSNFTITSGTSSVTISGQAGIAGAVLSYDNGGPQTVTADGSGNYTITVPSGWSGTVTPTLAGYTFTPPSRSYSNLTADQTGQNFTATSGSGGIPAIERAALIALYNSTNGDDWTDKTGWKTPPLAADGFALTGTEGSWKGITVSTDQVTAIYLQSNNLTGTIPSSLGNLTNLLNLWLENNQLTGTLPTEIGNLTRLESLVLGKNQLSGFIPSSIGNLTSPYNINLYSNQFTGTIPAEIGNLTSLVHFDLGGNQLTGTIPTWIGNLSNLQYLRLYSNQLTGSIPPELSNLSNLINLKLGGNQLTGTIPVELGNLSKLEILNLSGNQFTGSIPVELGNLSNLSELSLYSNQLTGSIPSELGNLSNLELLHIFSNQLTGNIPTELGNLGKLVTFYLQNNQLSGTIPASLGNLSNLQWLQINCNKLSGNIPTSLANLTQLKPGETNIGYNAIYTSDSGLILFLNANDTDWAATQTIAPTDVSATANSASSVTVSWTPIPYTADAGGYRVSVATNPGGPYTFFAQTADKTVSSQLVTGLNSSTAYYFVIQTRTNAHSEQQNIVDSEYSAEVTATTLGVTTYIISGTISVGGLPLTGVVMSGLPGNPATDAAGVYNATVDYNWSGTVTPVLPGYVFTPQSYTYSNVTANQAGQDFTAVYDSTEPNDDPASAAELPISTTADLIYKAGEVDWYKFFVPVEAAGQDLKVNVRVTSPYPDPLPPGWRSDIDFELLDSSLRVLGLTPSGSDNETLYLHGVASGWYYIYNDYCTTDYAESSSFARYAVTLETGTGFGIGYINGRVVNGEGEGIENVFVCLGEFPFDWNVSRPHMTSGPGGTFTVAYTPGIYDLLFAGGRAVVIPNYVPVNVVREYYNDKKKYTDADHISLASGQILNFGDVALDTGAIVSGHVTNTSGMALANVGVISFDAEGNGQDQFPGGTSAVYTDGSGDYSLMGIPVAGAKLRFSKGGYATEFYNDKPSVGSADTLSTQPGVTITAIDAQLGIGGTISGTVSDGLGAGIGNVKVVLYSVLDGTFAVASKLSANGSGNFNFRVMPGDYKIYFDTTGLSFTPEWYADASSFAAATVVNVTEGGTTSDINAQLLQASLAVTSPNGGESWLVGSSHDITWTSTGTIANVRIEVSTNGGANWSDIIASTSNDGSHQWTVPNSPSTQCLVRISDAANGSTNDTSAAVFAIVASIGGIAGRVSDGGGNGILNVRARVYDQNNVSVTYVYTNAQGNYTISNLPSGSYRLYFTNAAYVSEWYNDKVSFAAADAVTVTAGSTISGIDAVLASTGYIAGRVSDGGGNGILNVRARVYDQNNVSVAYVYTNAQGNYTVSNLPTGSYKVYFTHADYLKEWYNDKASFAAADTVTVTAGSTTSGIDAVLASAGYIAGRVSDGGGNGIQNVRASIYDLNNILVTYAYTNALGNYTILSLPTGSYKVYFTHADYLKEWYNDKASFTAADAVAVTAGSTTSGIDAVLASAGYIAGRVSNSGGGIQSVRASVYDLNNILVTYASTNAQGDYTVSSLPTGSYKVYFTHADYLKEWYNDKASFTAADAVAVTEGSTTSGIDAVLAPAGYIAGRVSNSGDNGIQSVLASVYDLNNIRVAYVYTNALGNYTVSSLPTGSYKVYFTHADYLKEWYNDKASFTAADAVAVTEGSTTSGIDAVLAPAGYIAGRVSNSGDNGIQSVLASVYDLNNIRVAYVYTNALGNYTVSSLPTGSYKVYFTHADYLKEWYNDKASFTAADTVTVTAGSTTSGIDAVLAPAGYIAGRVSDGDGNGIQNVRARVYDQNNVSVTYIYTNAQGDYTVSSLPTGSYKVYFTHAAYVSEWYNNKVSFAAADAVTVTAGSTTSGIDAVLASAGYIAGRVSDGGGNGILNARARVYDQNNVSVAYVYTNALGNYTVSNLPPGSYKVYFTHAAYVSEWYNDKASFAAADAVTVTAGSTTTNINAAMNGKAGNFFNELFPNNPDDTRLTLLAPNGNEILRPLTKQMIRWTNDPEVMEIKLEYSRNNGSTYATIADHLENSGRYKWTVPVNFTRNAIVRVSDSNGKPWQDDGQLEYSFRFNYNGGGEEAGAVLWFGSAGRQGPGYGFAKIAMRSNSIEFGGIEKAVESLADAWHELRVHFDFRHDTVSLDLDGEVLFENMALATSQNYSFEPYLTVQAGGAASVELALDDLQINIVQLDAKGGEGERFTVLRDAFDGYDEKTNALQSCWHWAGVDGKAARVTVESAGADNKVLRLRSAVGKTLLLYLPFDLPASVPFDISDQCLVIENQ